KLDATRGEHGIVGKRDAPEARHRHAGGGQALSHLELVARRGDRRRRAGTQAQSRGDGGGSSGRDVVYADDRRQRPRLAPVRDGGGRALGIGEVQRQQPVGRQRFQRARLLGGADEIDPERSRGVDEIFGAVGAGGQEQQQTRAPAHGTHGGAIRTCRRCSRGSCPARANWPSRGSAQQNQGSLRRGGRWRRAASPTGGGAGTPAAAAASARTPSNVTAASSSRSAATWTAAATSDCNVSIRGSGCAHS